MSDRLKFYKERYSIAMKGWQKSIDTFEDEVAELKREVARLTEKYEGKYSNGGW